MRTVGQHIALMRHALGKSPASGHDLYQTFQDAGNQLLQHEWSWAKRGPVALAFRAGVEFVELPPDFGRMVGLETPDSTYATTSVVPFQRIQSYRSGGLSTTSEGVVYMCFDAARRQKNPGVGSTAVAEVWPTPSTNDTPTVRMTYRCAFPRFTVADDDVMPDIDEQADLLLSLMAQDLAYLMENKRTLFDPQVIANELSRVKALDGSRQWMSGVMSGGALDRLPPHGLTVPVDRITVT
jgi:hypothetical protein